MTLNVLCVFNGAKYDVSYVAKLQAAVARHLPLPHRFLCITDRQLGLPNVHEIIAKDQGPGWWAKMVLFAPLVRGVGPSIYFDLDTVICGDISPLAWIAGNYKFAIFENWTKRAGHPTWPCRYASSLMTFGNGWGADIFRKWIKDGAEWMEKAGQYGDQMVVEWLYPDAPFLQSLVPKGFFLGYRDLEARHGGGKPAGCSVVVFGGSHKPHSPTTPAWAKEYWRG